MDYISDILGNQYREWRASDEVFIQTPTGSGKTTFILKTLSAYARQNEREILLLVNRKNLKNQIKVALLREHGVKSISQQEIKKIKDFEGITVLSYQEVQEQIKRSHYLLSSLFEERFQYIVFDEVHYFLQDATFNRDIPYLLGAIPKIKKAAKIFMSATVEDVYPYLRNLLKRREIPTTWAEVLKIMDQVATNSFLINYQEGYFRRGRVFFFQLDPQYKISQINYMKEIEEVIRIINKDGTDEKWLIFVNSKNEAKKLQKTITHACEYMDADVDEEDEIKKEIIKSNKFSKKVLITTKVLDNGISLFDEKLKNLVLLTTDKTEFLQMLGRKRLLNEEDSVHLFIMRRSIKYFNGLLNLQVRKSLEYVDEIEKDDKLDQRRLDDIEFFAFCQKMAIFHNGKILVSDAAVKKLTLEKKSLEQILAEMKLDGEAFIKEQLSWIGMEGTFSENNYIGKEERMENLIKARQKLIKFVQENVGKQIVGTDEKKLFRREITKLIKSTGQNLTDREKRLAGMAKINMFFKESGFPYRVISKQNSKVWSIEEVKKDETENIFD